MNLKTRADPEALDEVELDPFGFWPAMISKIRGLGGDEVGLDPNYAFHTAYSLSGSGALIFDVTIRDLKVSKGTIVVCVNALPVEAGGTARAVTVTQLPLMAVMFNDGRIRIEIDASSRLSYAVLGYIYDDTDASASGMSITMQRHDPSADFSQLLLDKRRSVFGKAKTVATARLVSDEPATLANPVSQMCTAAQFDEPVYKEWTDKLMFPKQLHRKQWEFVYILQSLRRYGVLEPGARGLAFGVGIEPLPAVMASMGCAIVATDLPTDDDRAALWNASQQHGASLENLRYPQICPDELLDQRVSYRPVDMTNIPEDLVEFDFTWSSCAYEHLGSIAAGLKFVEDSVQCLKPGGIAVHTTELNLTSNDQTLAEGDTVIFRRRDFERLALSLIAHGHEVAQIKYDAGTGPRDQHIDVPPYASNVHLKLAVGQYITTSFGIIVRRGADKR